MGAYAYVVTGLYIPKKEARRFLKRKAESEATITSPCDHEFDSSFCPECGKARTVKSTPEYDIYEFENILEGILRLNDLNYDVETIDGDDDDEGFMVGFESDETEDLCARGFHLEAIEAPTDEDQKILKGDLEKALGPHKLWDEENFGQWLGGYYC